MNLKPPVPENETARLEALYRYEVLDTPPEENFDRIARLAASFCNMPIALICLTDQNRQWLKSKVGASLTEVPRDISICAYTILQPDPLIVSDTLGDERFSQSPLVLDNPRIRFYAGVPLQTPEGFNVGTLCVVDRIPRAFGPEQQEALQVLARQVVFELEMRRTQAPTVPARHETEVAFSCCKATIDLLLSVTPVLFFRINRAGTFLDFGAGKNMIPYVPPDQFLGKTIEDVLPLEVAKKTRHYLHQALTTGVLQVFEYSLLEGEVVRHYEARMAAINAEEIVAVVRDTTEEKVKASVLEYHALHDTLTSLPNRVLFCDRLEQVILAGKRAGTSAAALILHVDSLSEITNTLGHQYGDRLLQEIGSRLKRILRAVNTVARLGEDIFGVLLPHAGADGSVVVSKKILDALSAPVVLDTLSLQAKISIGIALAPDHGTDTDTLLRRAEVAMYLALQSESGYAVYVSEHDPYTPTRLILMGDLRYALEHGEQLFLVYQPKVNLRTASFKGVEALLRWQHPQQGLIPPDKFIWLTEQTGLIKPLTQWVLDEALRQARAWQEAGLDIAVAVNLSARNLHDPRLPEDVAALLEKRGVLPSCLEVEITESALMADPVRAQDSLTQLSRMGIKIAIDDFGVGYSSLSYLKRLPVDVIKVEKSFTLGMTTNSNDAVIVRSIIELGHHLGLKVVAEGVENQEIYDRLVALGCDMAQGYHMSRPITPEQMMPWLKASPWGKQED